MAIPRPALTILTDIQDFIVPLTTEESEHLERRLLEEGCRDPLVVWRRGAQELVIVDGHNRFRICNKHKISFSFTEIEFEDLDHVKLWMIENQIGRRNLTQDQLCYYRGLKYLSLRKKKGGYRNMTAKRSTEESTALLLSKEFNVSESTIKRNAKFAEILNRVGEADPVLKRKILTGKVKVKRSEMNAFAELRDVKELVELINKEGEPGLELSNNAFPSCSQDKKLKKIRGMVVGIINRAIVNRSPSELGELKSLILKFELELMGVEDSSFHSMSLSEKSQRELEGRW